MPTLHWIGKEKVINHHLEVPYKILEHSYGYDNGRQSKNETGSGNKIIHGDNLEALKAILPEVEGRVKCIYIDPPYNTGNEGWVYNDNVNDPKIKNWLGQVVGKESECYASAKAEEKHLLGVANNTAYYFYYCKAQITTLDDHFLRTLKTKAEQYIIYADNCLLEESFMQKYHIIFKKIPRDITRF